MKNSLLKLIGVKKEAIQPKVQALCVNDASCGSPYYEATYTVINGVARFYKCGC